MIVSKTIILNNFEWIKNTQSTMDIIRFLGFYDSFITAYKIIQNLELSDIDITLEYIDKNKNTGSYQGIFDLFYEMNRIQKNRNTYLPNLYGLIIISS